VLRRSKNEKAGPTRILVVNDDPDACELIARIIESAGWIAERCHAHSDALAALSEAKPAFKAVLVDFQAGGASAGLKLLDDIRRMPAFTGMPVLLLTHNNANRLFAWQAGIDGFLVRPFHADQLINEVYAVLTRTLQERDAYREQRLSAG
jgi:two-component system, OmpR family, response regulator VanR